MPPPLPTAAATSHTTTTHSAGAVVDPLHSHPPSVPPASFGAAEDGEMREVAPLHLLDLRDPEVLASLHALIGALPEAVCAYLDARVFPECMNHQLMRLSASGQVPLPTSVVNPSHATQILRHGILVALGGKNSPGPNSRRYPGPALASASKKLWRRAAEYPRPPHTPPAAIRGWYTNTLSRAARKGLSSPP